MQEKCSNTKMDDEANPTNAPTSRSRSSKLKVLGRSHAMREEASSPPPSPHLQPPDALSPRIELTPSPETTPREGGALSPAGGGNGGPLVVLSQSPASTVVATPTSRCSPSCDTDTRLQPCADGDNRPSTPTNGHNKSSHRRPAKYYCDCESGVDCINCAAAATQQRNINNNLTGGVYTNNVAMVTGSPNRLSVSRTSSRGKLKQQSSSQSSCSFDTTGSINSPCLSRDNSAELYTDTTGVDLEQFIPETLNRNAKDRALMLRIEQELVSLAKDKNKTHFKFPPMSSYQRMLVHRCAAYFGMDHNVEPSGKCVVVNRTRATRVPDIPFRDRVKEDIAFSDSEPRRSILKRDSNSVEEYGGFKSPDRGFGMESRRSKSFEEREEEYEKVRRRIFNREMQDGSAEEFMWSEIPWSSSDSDYSSRFRLHPPELQSRHYRRLLKVHSEDTGEINRPYVAKSYSFGGYGGSGAALNRGDSVMSAHSAGPRLLTKQDSGASSVSWRLSPSSSGYKSQSQMSESITPSPTSTPHPMGDSRQDSNSSGEHQDTVISDDSHVVWAVTNIHSVPKGSVIINPQTGKPIKNQDGTIYHFDPKRPPPGLAQPPSPTHKGGTVKEHPPSSTAKANQQQHKAGPVTRESPAKRCSAATSPSLPYTPPPQPTAVKEDGGVKGFAPLQAITTEEPAPPISQQFPVFNSGFTSNASENVQIYQQPYTLYTNPYGLPQQQYDTRMDQPPPLPEVTSTFYIPDAAVGQHGQPVAYQHAAGTFWNQQPITYYPNSAHSQSVTPPQRFPMQAQAQTAFVPATYPPAPASYLPPGPAAGAPPPAPQNAELIPVYPHHHPQQQQPPMSVVYGQNGAATVIYQSQPPQPHGVVFASQNAVYSPGAGLITRPDSLATNLPTYPQTTQTPNSCSSSASNPHFMTPQDHSQGFVQLAQSMQQLSLMQHNAQAGRTFIATKCSQQQFDPPPYHNKPPHSAFPKRNSYPGPPPRGSSQSSTGTNSPAATIIAAAAAAGHYGAPPSQQQQYRTPPGTPQCAQFAAATTAFPVGFGMPPVLFRQLSSASTGAIDSRTSRSPTPASDIAHFDRQKVAHPPNIYQGMPYIVQPDTRLMAGRGQPSVYRHVFPFTKQQSFNQPDGRSQAKGRRKGNRTSLPPSGKPV